MAKVSRRGFFGRAVGGFAAALGLGEATLDIKGWMPVPNGSGGYRYEYGVWERGTMRWDGMIYPPPGGYTYAVSPNVIWTELGPFK